MVKRVQFPSSKDLMEFIDIARECTSDVGVHTYDDKMADAKSILGLLSLDYTQPVKVVTEDTSFYRYIQKWIVA